MYENNPYFNGFGLLEGTHVNLLLRLTVAHPLSRRRALANVPGACRDSPGSLGTPRKHCLPHNSFCMVDDVWSKRILPCVKLNHV